MFFMAIVKNNFSFKMTYVRFLQLKLSVLMYIIFKKKTLKLTLTKIEMLQIIQSHENNFVSIQNTINFGMSIDSCTEAKAVKRTFHPVAFLGFYIKYYIYYIFNDFFFDLKLNSF